MKNEADAPEDCICNKSGDFLEHNPQSPYGWSWDMGYFERRNFKADFYSWTVFESPICQKFAVMPGREEKVERWIAFGRLKYGVNFKPPEFEWPEEG